jgi:4'-phosphopantetheinyl transferase
MPWLQTEPVATLPLLPWKSDDYTLKPNRIDIWQYSLEQIWPEAFSILNTSEQHRAKRYHFERHQRRFIIARAMLRMILSRYLQCESKAIVFAENKYGKPELIGSSIVQFNLSHSRESALLAIGHTHPLGIDLEYFSNRSLAGISKLVFSDAEIKRFSHVTPANRSLSFFHIWAQKEAFIKACGMGLSYPLQSFDVPHLPPTHQMIFDPLHKKHWIMRSFMPEPACCAALCCHPETQTLRYQIVRKNHHVFTR